MQRRYSQVAVGPAPLRSGPMRRTILILPLILVVAGCGGASRRMTDPNCATYKAEIAETQADLNLPYVKTDPSLTNKVLAEITRLQNLYRLAC